MAFQCCCSSSLGGLHSIGYSSGCQRQRLPAAKGTFGCWLECHVSNEWLDPMKMQAFELGRTDLIPVLGCEVD